MNNFKATPKQWEEVGAFVSATRDCILELRARVEALEAQAGNLKGSLTSSTPPPVATDEELRKLLSSTNTLKQAFRAIYNLGIEHGQAGSREVAEPAPVAGEMAVLVADLRRMAAYATAACRFSDGETLTSAANMLQQEAGR
jgi:hypothetical protein